MKVSVIIPCHNYDKYIEQCIMSVLLQRVNFDVEILIGDDNSSDDSYETIKRLKYYYECDKFKFHIIKNDINIGEVNNTKQLIDNSSGDYIAYLDADDYWINPYKLQKQVNFMENNTDYSMCFTGYIMLSEGKYIPNISFTNWLCPVDINKLDSENLVYGNFVGSSSSRLFRNYKDLISDNFYNFFEASGIPGSDWALNFELSLRGKIQYLDFAGYLYRTHNDSLSKKMNHSNTEENIKKRIDILKKVKYNEQ